MNDSAVELVENALLVNRRKLLVSSRAVLQDALAVNGRNSPGREALPIAVERHL